jgi:phosphopantetheinyl transferase
MKRDDSDWVNDQFAASARDWTPVSARHAAYVLYAPFSRDPEVSRRCGSVLSDAELQRVDRFLTEDGKVQFQQRRAFRRYCGACVLGSRRPLSQIVFQETEKGRPYLPDLPNVWFSFSSCRFGVLAAWSSTHGVGIDLEDHTRNLEATELARWFFSKAEARAVERACPRTFVNLWTLKEAALKSIGEGLSMGLDAFEFELTPNLRVIRAPGNHGGPERFIAQLIDGTNSCAALVMFSAFR